MKKHRGFFKSTVTATKWTLAKVTKPVRKVGNWCLDKYVAYGDWSERRGVTKANQALGSAAGVVGAVAVPAILGAKKGL